jgi:hypothetical protein
MPSTTTSSSKKKTSTRAKRISVDEAEKEKEAAILKAKEEAIAEERDRAEKARISASMNIPDDNEWDEEEEEDDTPSFGNHAGAYFEDTNLPEDPDIFEMGRALEDQGRDISYYIKKDNAFLVELYTATSLEELKKKYGGGKYTIAIKNSNGQWIKQKTIRVHGPIEAEPKVEAKEQYFPPQQNVPQVDLNQMFQGTSQMFMQMQEMANRERSRSDRDEKKGSDSFNSTLFSVISEQGKSTQSMIMEMQRNNMEMLKSISENTTRSLEKAEERNRDMLREMRDSGSKKEEFGLKDMLAMIEASRSNGMDTMRMALDMSETLADIRTPAVSEPSDSKEGLMTTLTKAMLPLITKAGQQTAPGVPQQAVQMPGLPAQRQVQQTQNPVRQNPQGHVQNVNRQAVPVQKPIRGNGQYQETRVQNIEKNPLASLGLATFADRTSNNVSQVSPRGEQSPHRVLGHEYESSEEFIEKTMKDLNDFPEPDISKEPQAMSDEAKEGIETFKAIMPIVRESDVYKKATQAQKNIVELGLPVIAQYINDEDVTAETVAHFVIDESASQGFSPQVLAKEFTFDFLLQIASNFGIGEEKNEWFGEFYEAIQDVAGVSTSGEEESATS